jgi:hypothetical protein
MGRSAVTVTPKNAEPTSPTASEALIYLPGLALGLTTGKTPRGVVDRLAMALDAEAQTRTATFAVEWRDGIFGGEPEKSVATIKRTDGDDSRPIVDVFVYDWAGTFKDGWENQNLFHKAGRAILGVFAFPKFIRFFMSSGRSTPFGRIQLALAALMVAIVVAYAAILIVAVGQLVYQTVQVSETPSVQPAVVQSESAPASSEASGSATQDKSVDNEARLTLSQWLALIGATVAAFIPKVRDRVNQLGATLAAASSYLRVARGQQEIVGGFQKLVAKLNDSGQYESIRVLSYSFGSIVALDTLYPTTGRPPRSLDAVTSLVTIGCPVDFAMAMRKNWLSDRSKRDHSPEIWLNIYSKIDLLGSDFTRRTKLWGDTSEQISMLSQSSPGAVVHPTSTHHWNLGVEPTWGNLLEFYGFSSHGMYWGSDSKVDSNVFREVVRGLYPNSSILA